MYLFLTLLSGISWTVVYVAAIVVGLRQRTYAIPSAALALNIAWETIYAGHGWAAGGSVQAAVNVVWAVADLVIVGTFLRFGRAELGVSRAAFAGWSVLLLVTGYAVQLLFVVEFGWDRAAGYSAFLQNLLMSGLFIALFAARGGARGQGLVIAVAKFVGTLAPTLLFGALQGSVTILGIGLLCAVFDLVYLGLLIHARAGGRR